MALLRPRYNHTRIFYNLPKRREQGRATQDWTWSSSKNHSSKFGSVPHLRNNNYQALSDLIGCPILVSGVDEELKWIKTRFTASMTKPFLFSIMAMSRSRWFSTFVILLFAPTHQVFYSIIFSPAPFAYLYTEFRIRIHFSP